VTAVLLIIVQIVTGSQKMAQMERSNTKIRRWHGDLGLLVWDLLCLTMLAGMAEIFAISYTHLLVELILLVLWLATHVQMRRKPFDRPSVASSSPAAQDDEAAQDGAEPPDQSVGANEGDKPVLREDFDFA
jgi:hypothetical protein